MFNPVKCMKRAKLAWDLRGVKRAMGGIKSVDGKIHIERIHFNNVVVFENEQGHIVIKSSDS